MDNTTLLIIILLILLVFGGGYYGRGRWWQSPDFSECTVPEVLASRQMTDARHHLRLHPPSIGETQFRKWAAFELADFQAGTQFISFGATKGDKGRWSDCFQIAYSGDG